MRCTLSFTDVSGKPTRMVFGMPPPASTSTSTGTASMPTRAKVFSLASTGGSAKGVSVVLLPDLDLRRSEMDQPFDDQPAHRHDKQHEEEKRVERNDGGLHQPGAVVILEPAVFHDRFGTQREDHIEAHQDADADEAQNRRYVVEHVIAGRDLVSLLAFLPLAFHHVVAAMQTDAGVGRVHEHGAERAAGRQV